MTNNLSSVFEAVVRQFAGRPAVMFSGSEQYSFADLDRLSNRIVGVLRDAGVGKSDVVCISGDKRIEAYATIVACIKLGAIYAVIDSESPVERLDKILTNCHPKVIIGEVPLLESLGGIAQKLEISLIENNLTDAPERLERYSGDRFETDYEISKQDAAYIMFTSGSTGFPKGAVITHGNLLNFIKWSKECFDFSEDDRLTNVNPLYFDNSVFDIYSSLFTGACLVPFSKSEVAEPKKFVDKVAAVGCTSWFSVPSLLIYLTTMKLIVPETMPTVKRYIFGGEGYPKQKLKALFDAYSGHAELFNVYGPTECTCICSCYRISKEDFHDLNGIPPLGELIDGFSYLILDDEDERVPDGEAGELCLMGESVGLGYYADEERTSKSFMSIAAGNGSAERGYRTGDLVRYDPDDGYIHFVGRKDNQIKHMGYRIELDEIEHALNQISDVTESAVVYTLVNGFGNIVAFVAGDERVHLDEKEIKRSLGEKIPNYMIPSRVYFFDFLPKNANGKINRKDIYEIYMRKKCLT